MDFVDSEDALYKELWHACAGPLVTVPRVGERVFYFPQGHLEQVLLLSVCVIFSLDRSSIYDCYYYHYFAFVIFCFLSSEHAPDFGLIGFRGFMHFNSVIRFTFVF